MPRAAGATTVKRDGVDDADALETLLDPERHLVTYPGDEYLLVYTLPQSGADLEFFMDSKGYYYEWMRAEWLKDEDLKMAALVLTDPARVLRILAPAFKRAEPDMERLFWESRFGR